jgi:hypothetical protein
MCYSKKKRPFFASFIVKISSCKLQLMLFTKKIKLIVLFALGLTTHSKAQFRKYSNEFLNIGAGARSMAMGGAQVASTKDGTAGYWNPAGLANHKETPLLTLQHAEYFAGIGKYDFGSLIKPLQDGKRTIGFSLVRFAVDDIPNTLYLVEPDGTINYGNISTFSSADYAGLLSYSSEIKATDKRKISFGGNVKIIRRVIGKFANAWGFGLDLGIQSVGKKGGVGVVLRDVTSTFNTWSFNFTEREKEIFYLTKNEIPLKSTELTAPRLILGGYHDFKLNTKLVLKTEGSIDVTFDGKRNTLLASNIGSVDPKFGMELGINNSVFLRAGVTNFQKALADKDTINQKKVWIFQPSAGVGFHLKDITIDYAFSNLANQSEPLYTHIVTLSLLLKKAIKK